MPWPTLASCFKAAEPADLVCAGNDTNSAVGHGVVQLIRRRYWVESSARMATHTMWARLAEVVVDMTSTLERIYFRISAMRANAERSQYQRVYQSPLFHLLMAKNKHQSGGYTWPDSQYHLAQVRRCLLSGDAFLYVTSNMHVSYVREDEHWKHWQI